MATEQDIENWTDVYFKRTRKIIEQHGDVIVTYAMFMRRPAISAPKMAIDWLTEIAKQRNIDINIDLRYPEATWIGAGEPIFYLTGPMAGLCDLETQILQKIGAPCIAAYNAYAMCEALPHVKFMAFDARHCAGLEMADMMAYAAKVGSQAAKDKCGAKGFIGNATDATAHYFGLEQGLGTMPHALIGYAGSTLEAAKMFHETHPEVPLTVLVDYFGREVTDSLDVCRHFKDLAANGTLSVRLDTPGGRYVEGLDPQASYAVLERNVPDTIRGYRTESELKHLIGTGVSAAAIWHMREQLDQNGFENVKIIASSGFSAAKCKAVAAARVPVDAIGTGSYLPQKWSDTYTTADIVIYDGKRQVKVGREFLIPEDDHYQEKRLKILQE